MTLNELKSIIRKTVKQQLKEASQKLSSPKNLSDFRLALSHALEQAGAPADLVDEVSDVGYEGGGVFEAVFSTWRNIEAEMQSESPDKRGDVYLEIAPYYIHDLIIDLAAAYQDPMNYEPGRRVKKLNTEDLANKVKAAMFPVMKKSPADMKSREMRDMLGLVTDMVTEAGGRVVSQTENSVKFNAVDDEAFRLDLPVQAKLAGLKPSGPGSWTDDITGLTVTFGANTATVS